MTIPDSAVEAALDARTTFKWRRSGDLEENARIQMRHILEAAIPHIAASIELLVLDPSKSSTPHCIEEYNAGLKNAVLAVRGTVVNMDK